MDSTLLATKLHIPPETSHLVERGRLVAALARGVLEHKLISISAPAGYGKTTLLAQWARASSARVAWLSLSEEENDPDRFLRYLYAAWREAQPGIRETPLDLLLGAMEPDRDAVLSAFINVANDQPEHTVLVLDDIHAIGEPAIHAALTFLIDHVPPTLHFVLAGRADPPLPLARFRAHRELLELRAEDLRFAVEETGDFLHRHLRLDLTPDEIERLHAQLEGWPAGLQLASLTLRHRGVGRDPLGVSGRHRFIADYLGEDVLAHLPGDVQRFLLQTSILDRLSGPLCDAVAETGNSQAMLEQIERENLFLMPLDARREWFRYHRLFADFLRDALRRRHPDEVPPLHRRAAHWFLAHDLPEPAFDHAVAAGELDLVIQIFELHGNDKLQTGEYRVVQRWLDALPEAWYAAYPVFDLARAGLLAFSGAVDECMRCIDDVEQKLLGVDVEDARPQLARVTAIRCAIACMRNDLAQAEEYADQALRDLADDDLGFRPMIYGALGDSYRGHSRWAEARACYLKVLDFAHAPVFRAESANVFGALADLDLRQGHLRDAAGNWRKALAAVQEPENWGRLSLPVIGWIYLRLGELLYERNDLAAAWDHLSRGLERAELSGDVRAMIAGYVMAGRVKLTEGDVEAAGAWLERAQPLVEGAAFPEWTSRFERCQLELWLAQDRLRAAADWAQAALRDDTVLQRPDSESAQLALARVLIVRGDEPSRERALALLERLLHSAETEGRIGVQIETLALQALSEWRSGDRAGALTALERALHLAEPEGYVRLIVDLGLPMARLLQEARARDVMPDYVATLLAAFGAGAADVTAGGPSLPEPLSAREQEVLTLMAAGLTNREIAGALFISPETVKKHTGSIYGKLGVSHRTEAAARARALDLLE